MAEEQGYRQVTIHETDPVARQVVGNDGQGRQFTVEVVAHGSSTAFTDLAAGSADIGRASRPVKPQEVSELSNLGKLDDVRSEYVVGLDGVAVIVNPANPLASLDKDTVRRIFAGELHDWSELGGKPGAIRVLARDDKSGTYDTFKHLVLEGDGKLTVKAGRFESSAELVREVAGDPLAIGFVGLAYIKGVKALGIADGGAAIVPEPFSVATEDYALARRLFLYVPTRGEKWRMAHDFAQFAVSTEGQLALAPLGFISQEIETRGVAHTNGVPEEYAHFTSGARRLSLNFRLTRGSSNWTTRPSATWRASPPGLPSRRTLSVSCCCLALRSLRGAAHQVDHAVGGPCRCGGGVAHHERPETLQSTWVWRFSGRGFQRERQRPPS